MNGKQLAGLQEYFQLPGKDYGLRELRQGLIHNTYLLLNHGVPEFILQQINTRVFPDVPALMGNLCHALPFLSAEDYQHIEVIKTKDGGLYLDKGDAGCWRVLTYVSGSITHNTTSRPGIAREAGRVICRFHSLLKDAPGDEFIQVLPGFHDLELRKRQFVHALENASEVRKSQARQALSIAGKFMEYPFPADMHALPTRICHNDTKLNNILFSEKGEKALCLIDLDTIMPGSFLYDFGDAVRTIVNTAPEDERSLDKIRFSRPLFGAFVDGLACEPALLHEAEVKHLPYGSIYMPLLHGLRALTDFLSGDIYYQVAYDMQNLDRSMSLLTFALRAAGELDYMHEVVQKKLGRGGN